MVSAAPDEKRAFTSARANVERNAEPESTLPADDVTQPFTQTLPLGPIPEPRRRAELRAPGSSPAHASAAQTPREEARSYPSAPPPYRHASGPPQGAAEAAPTRSARSAVIAVLLIVGMASAFIGYVRSRSAARETEGAEGAAPPAPTTPPRAKLVTLPAATTTEQRPIPIPIATTSATTTAASTTPPAAASSALVPSQPGAGTSGEGLVRTSGLANRRIFVDDKVMGQTPASVTVKCGRRTVRLGSAGKPQVIDVPCGGEVTVNDKN